MNETGKRSGKLSRQVAGLGSAVIRLFGWRKDNQEIPMVNLELIAMVMALHTTEYSDYDPSAVLEYYRMQVSLTDENVDGILKQIDYYSLMTRRQIIDEAVQRILYVFVMENNETFGSGCSNVPLSQDALSNEYQKERQIRNTLPQFISSIMGYRQDELGLGGENCEYVGVDEEDDVNTELTAEEMAEPEYEEEEEKEETVEITQPMRFHWFWSHIALPLSALSSAIYVLVGIMSIGKEGMIMIVDILLNAGWFVFGIPALKGLYKFTSDGFDANNKLLIYLIGVRGVCALILAFLTGVAGMAIYMPDLIWALCGIGIKKYYEKRKEYFTK